MGGLLCCYSKEKDWHREVLRESGAKVELGGLPWNQSVSNELGIRDDVFRYY